MTNGKFNALAIDHFQRLAFLVTTIRIKDGAATKNRFSLCTAQNNFRLENPRGILSFFRLGLIVHQKNRHEPVALGQLGAHDA